MGGLTELGFEAERIDEIKEAIEEDFRTNFGENVRVDSESVNGQLIGVLSDRLADLWELAEQTYAFNYLNSASGVALDDLVALAGIVRAAATYSEVELTLLGAPDGTVIPIGSQSKDDLGTIWEHTTEGTITGGIATVTARPLTTGPIRGLSGTITTINTPVAGWSLVSNILDAEEGTSAESDAKLRERYRSSMRLGLGSSADAVRAALMRLDGVTEVVVLENKGITTNSDGLPPKSLECIVRGGAVQEIADTIWLSAPAGIETYGNQANVVTDFNGDSQTVNWSRPEDVDVYITIELDVEDNFPLDGDTLVLDEVLDYLSSFTIGQAIYPFRIAQHIETGQINEATIYVGLSSSPSMSDPLILSKRELAHFDSSFIEIVKV